MVGNYGRLVTAIGAIVISACAGVVQAEDAAEQVRRVSKEINTAGVEYGKACGIAMNAWSQENRDKARLRYVDCMLVLHKYTYTKPELKVDDSKEGRALEIAYTEWLDRQVANMNGAGLEYIRILEDESLGFEQTKESIMELVKRQAESERPYNEKLGTALKAYDAK